MKLIKFFPNILFPSCLSLPNRSGIFTGFFSLIFTRVEINFWKKKCAHNFAALLDSLPGRVDELAGGDSPRLYLASDGINN